MRQIIQLCAVAGALLLSACATTASSIPAIDASAAQKLNAAAQAQPEKAQARFDARNPVETLSFFEVMPGMTVVEALPGGGWYTKILIPYLGAEGKIIGAQYPDALWSQLPPGQNPEWVATRIERAKNWPEQAREMAGETAIEIDNHYISQLNEELKGTADRVLFIRALHNLNRLESTSGYLTAAVNESYEMLKPGGIVGVVQHRAPEGNSDEWASGSAGYLKQSYVIDAFERAGFELIGTSDVNANPKDQPSESDFVWRLPPSFSSTEEGTSERTALAAIGESNRMTLKFRKPN